MSLLNLRMINFNSVGRWSISLSIVMSATLLGCNNIGKLKSSSTNAPGQAVQDLPPGGAPSPTQPVPVYLPTPLLWESAVPSALNWSKFLMSLFQNELKDVLDSADDIELFCPKYNGLKIEQKANALAMLLSAMSKFESNFNPLARMQETTMGTDPVTNLPVYSEGLLQLSYQDITGWPFCKFDWNKDKHLKPNDPKKTILDPLINLDCGARIFAQQIQRYHKIVIDSGAYWAVIKQNGRFEKISEISDLVRQNLKVCQ